jgi:hypothetical protein
VPEGGAWGAGAGGLGLKGWAWFGARRPRGSGRALGGAGEPDEAGLVGVGARQSDLDPGDQFGDPGGNLDQGEAQGVELGGAPERGLGRQAAERVQEPVGGGVDQQPELVGGGPGAGGAVGGEVQLVRLDQVLRLPALAVDRLVKPARRAGDIGDDEAGIGALGGGLDPGDDLARLSSLRQGW